MRQQFLIPSIVMCGLMLSACEKETEEEKIEKTFQEVNVIDETNLNEVLLTAADPNEAVTYFQGAAAKNPGRNRPATWFGDFAVTRKTHNRSGSSLEKSDRHERRDEHRSGRICRRFGTFRELGSGQGCPGCDPTHL